MRTFFFACLVTLPLLASGCLRTKFDLCAQTTPDPGCPIDGGDTGVADAGTDGGGTTSDAATSIDAAPSIDAGADAP